MTSTAVSLGYYTYTSTPISCSASSIAGLEPCVAAVAGGPVGFYTYDGNYTGGNPGGFTDVVASHIGCPAHSQPTGNTCTCNDPYIPDSTGTSCVSEQYTLSLQTDPAQQIEPSGSARVIAKVINTLTGQPKEGVTVSIKIDVDVTSGGHDHGERIPPRPKGALSPATGTTGPDGTVSFNFGAPEVSGTHTFTASCVSPACTNEGTARMDVKVDGLAPIPDDPTPYALVGGEADKQHHDNHYLTNSAFNQLVVLAINYHFLYPNEPVLHLNDASLVWGGLFDKDGDWDTPHEKHRRGVVIDIRANMAPGNIPESLFTDFKALAAKTQTTLAGRVISANAKLHCSDGFDPKNNCVGDNNRHFHVILLGVDQ